MNIYQIKKYIIILYYYIFFACENMLSIFIKFKIYIIIFSHPFFHKMLPFLKLVISQPSQFVPTQFIPTFIRTQYSVDWYPYSSRFICSQQTEYNSIITGYKSTWVRNDRHSSFAANFLKAAALAVGPISSLHLPCQGRKQGYLLINLSAVNQREN